MYQDTIIKKYIDLISATNKEIKMFYQGDPVKIPNSALPCCIISKRATAVGQITNSQDEHEVGLNITIVTDIREELSTDNDGANLAPGIAKLYELVEGRDANYKLKADSILNILRTNQLVDSANNLRTDLKTTTRIDYGQTLRQRNPAMWSVEARVEIIVNFIQIR